MTSVTATSDLSTSSLSRFQGFRQIFKRNSTESFHFSPFFIVFSTLLCCSARCRINVIKVAVIPISINILIFLIWYPQKINTLQIIVESVRFLFLHSNLQWQNIFHHYTYFHQLIPLIHHAVLLSIWKPWSRTLLCFFFSHSFKAKQSKGYIWLVRPVLLHMTDMRR